MASYERGLMCNPSTLVTWGDSEYHGADLEESLFHDDEIGGVRMTVAKMALMLVRVTGLIQIVLGIGLWMGHGKSLTPVHMWIGLVLVLSLWVLAVAGRAESGGGLVALAFLWGAVTAWLGMRQTLILPGAHHELVRVLHLVVGLTAIGLAESLGRRIKNAGSSTASRTQPATG
jgi:hypothetical protein